MEEKKRGRPKKPTTAKLIRMPDGLIEAVDKAATSEGMPFNAYVIHLLYKALK